MSPDEALEIAKQPPTQEQLEAADRYVAEYEEAFAMSSEDMLRALHEGLLYEDFDICIWILRPRQRDYLYALLSAHNAAKEEG